MPKLRLFIFRTSRKGDFDHAVRMDQIFSHFPAYGTSMKGLFLVQDGRYADAQALLKPRAFDGYGKPLFLRPEFHWYLIALVNDGSPEVAEPLLEEAIHRCHPARRFKLTLASCLLDRRKNPERACELIEQIIKERPEKLHDERYPLDAANLIARHSWALAACGRRLEAQARIEEAMQRLPTLDYWDAACFLYFIGEAWNALGDFVQARKALQLSIDILPRGEMAIASRKALAKIAEV